MNTRYELFPATIEELSVREGLLEAQLREGRNRICESSNEHDGGYRQDPIPFDLLNQVGRISCELKEVRQYLDLALPRYSIAPDIDRITIGHQVLVRQEGEEEEFVIIGTHIDARMLTDRTPTVISETSPMGQVLLGSRVGETRILIGPDQDRSAVEIIDVRISPYISHPPDTQTP